MDPAWAPAGLVALTDLLAPPEVHLCETPWWQTDKVVLVRPGPRRVLLFGSPAALRALLDQADERNPFGDLPVHVVFQHIQRGSPYRTVGPGAVAYDVYEPGTIGLDESPVRVLKP